MRFYISTTGIKRLTISSAGAGNGKGSPAPAATRRFSGRTLLPLVLVLALVLPFLFVRIAFIVLESAAACSSSPGKFNRTRLVLLNFLIIASVKVKRKYMDLCDILFLKIK